MAIIASLLSKEPNGSTEEGLEEQTVDWSNSVVHNKIECIHSSMTSSHSCVTNSMPNLHSSAANSMTKSHGSPTNRMTKIHCSMTNHHCSITNIVAKVHCVVSDHVGGVHGHVSNNLDRVCHHAPEGVTGCWREFGAQVWIIIGTAVGAFTASTSNFVNLLSQNIATFSIVADIQAGVESAISEGCNSTTNSGGFSPQHLTVVTGSMRKLVLSDAGRRKHLDFIEPRINGRNPIILQTRPCIERLVNILANTEPLHFSAIWAIMVE